MAENRYNPTFANILSSLKVKGATIKGGSGKDGHVPILNDNGELDLSVIPISSIENSLTIQPLSKIAFVNPNDTRPDLTRDGSIALPYTSLSSAAAGNFTNFIVVPGSYASATVAIMNNNGGSTVNIFGLGYTSFNGLTFTGYSESTVFRLYNINITGTLAFDNNTQYCTLILEGDSSISSITSPDMTSPLEIYVGAHCEIGETDGNAVISYLSSSSRVKNDSQHVEGDTVSDAVDILGTRKIRIPIFTADSHGLRVDSSDYEEISVPEDDDTYSVVAIGTTLASAINGLFHKNGDSPVYSNVDATNISATDINTTSITTQTLKFGTAESPKAIITVDSNNFLVVS